jgi:hypothetical protein
VDAPAEEGKVSSVASSVNALIANIQINTLMNTRAENLHESLRIFYSGLRFFGILRDSLRFFEILIENLQESLRFG